MSKKNYSYADVLRDRLVKNNYFSAVVLLCASLYMTVILLSFNPHDPSWFFYTTEAVSLTNKGGWLGAHFSALLFFLFGSAIFFLIPILLFLVYMRAQKKTFKEEWDRLLGGFLLLYFFAALSSLYRFEPFYDIQPGGMFGSFLHTNLTKLLDVNLAAFFVHLMIIISLVLITRFSLVSAVGYIFRTIRFYSTQEYFFVAVKSIYRFVCKLTYPFVWSWQHACKLFAGEDIHNSGKSIVEFETIVIDEFHACHDTFWDAHLKADAPIQSVPEQKIEPVSRVKNIDVAKKTTYTLPTVSLLSSHEKSSNDEKLWRTEQEQFAMVLQEKLVRFGIQGTVSSIKSGPVITLIEYEPHIDSKISKIIALEDDLALALEAMSIRIIAPIPGRSVVGFEIANKKRQSVILSETIHSSLFKQFSGHLPLALGKDTIGNSVVVDLVTMPHLLIAGSTGSGKSVALNTMLISMLYRCKPEDLKLVLIDPKRLEFASYADIPHLLFPIVTDPQRAVLSLKWVVKTMEKRYEHMATCGVRNIFEYQHMSNQNPALESMPLIVVMIDELSDLMMTAGKEVEGYIARIAQMARAAGIYLIVATQRPSVDVITGLIKVNFPSRISFRVTSKADSRTILDVSGAEKLLGKGDMLFMDSGSGLKRIHGGYVSHKEVEQLVQYIRSQQEPQYLDLYEEVPEGGATLSDADDALYQEIIAYIKSIDEVSISLLQRRFRIGYNRSARIIEQLETQGLIMPAEGGKGRKVIR